MALMALAAAPLAAEGYDEREFYRPSTAQPSDEGDAAERSEPRVLRIKTPAPPPPKRIRAMTSGILLEVRPNSVAAHLGLQPGDHITVPLDDPNFYHHHFRAGDRLGPDYTIIPREEIARRQAEEDGRSAPDPSGSTPAPMIDMSVSVTAEAELGRAVSAVNHQGPGLLPDRPPPPGGGARPETSTPIGTPSWALELRFRIVVDPDAL